jgi:hypothetical protein
MTRLARAVALLAIASCLGGASTFADSTPVATPKNYAYLYLQGKIADPVGGRPLTDATVRLLGNGEVFETATDQRGSFVFERLPVRSYVLDVVTADGKVLRNLRDIDPDDPFPDRARVRINLGQGPAQSLSIETNENHVTVLVPQPTTRWSRLWKQLGIFIGAAAGLLAL